MVQELPRAQLNHNDIMSRNSSLQQNWSLFLTNLISTHPNPTELKVCSTSNRDTFNGSLKYLNISVKQGLKHFFLPGCDGRCKATQSGLYLFDDILKVLLFMGVDYISHPKQLNLLLFHLINYPHVKYTWSTEQKL